MHIFFFSLSKQYRTQKSKLRKASMLQDLDAADQAFLNAGVAAPTLVRPPYGAVNKSVKNASGRTVVTWTVDTQDWMSQDAQTVIDYVQGDRKSVV